MSCVVVERTLPEALSPESVREVAGSAQGCLDAHGASYVRAYLRGDGRRLICVFEAPDAESVPIANRQIGMPFDRVYRASLHEPPAAAGRRSGAASHVLVERTFDEPTPFEDVQAMEDRGAWCLDMHDVRFVRTFFSTDRRRMLCLYDAPDADSVRLANRKTGVPFDTAWTATVIEI
jgi:hypothetical protein